MKPKHHWHCADSVRELGITVGEIIQGREEYNGFWSDARLTLLYLGEQIAVWRVHRRSSYCPDEWVDDGEAANWTLDCRDWQKVSLASLRVV